MKVCCFYDYTCRYSYRALLLLQRLRSLPDLEVSWATFSLKETNLAPGTASLFDDTEVSSVSVFALALAHAARGADFDGYHFRVFDAMQGQGLRLTKKDLLQCAADAGVDARAFERDKTHWVSSVAKEHADAVSRWGVFGTPTLVLDDTAAIYLKLTEPPPTEEKARELWDALWTISVSYPELVEIKRPR